jgi:hypothetical protein
MTVTVMRDTIVCPGCGGRRVVSARQLRTSRLRGGILCTSCRGGSSTRTCKDGDLRFWLGTYGVEVPLGVPVREFIAAGGAPRDLVELARECYPDAIVT